MENQCFSQWAAQNQCCNANKGLVILVNMSGTLCLYDGLWEWQTYSCLEARFYFLQTLMFLVTTFFSFILNMCHKWLFVYWLCWYIPIMENKLLTKTMENDLSIKWIGTRWPIHFNCKIEREMLSKLVKIISSWHKHMIPG